MKKTFENFHRLLVIAIATAAFAAPTYAAVTARPTAANTAAAARAQNRTGARVPTSTTQIVATTPTIMSPEPEPVVIPDPEPEPTEPVIIVDNKTSMFNDVMAELGTTETDMSSDARADAIRRQRALLDNAANTPAAATLTITAGVCDNALRKCMAEKCGNDFTQCANDSTTIWGQKMELCRAQTKCTAHEYALLAPEILADRDMNVYMAHYNSVINCGNRYNSCIFAECGTTLNRCLAKKDGDNAISKCAKIANDCKSLDNGLAARTMSVFGDLRKIATARVQRDEARLYELRDLMRAQCTRLGAMFDERTLDCVYTVNFFAGDDNTLMASKKLYSGDTFQCNADWFGVDITTFKENAYRMTGEQTSASSAIFGAGVGAATGLASSGAISRARNTRNAEAAVKEACQDAGGNWNGQKCVDANGNEITFDNMQNSSQEGVNNSPTSSGRTTGNQTSAQQKQQTKTATQQDRQNI